MARKTKSAKKTEGLTKEQVEDKIMALSAQDVLRTVKQATSKEDMLFLTAVAMEWVLTKMIEKGY